MSHPRAAATSPGRKDNGRRQHVLDAALDTFARYGYRKTSMDDVARAADISRPGLYFLFTSKQELFRATVTRALSRDVSAARECLSDTRNPLRDRLVEAFDLWTGRYVGPMAAEIADLVDAHPDLLGSVVIDHPAAFAQMVTEAVLADPGPKPSAPAEDVARTLLSLANGIKHEAKSREEFLSRLTVGIDLILPTR